MFTIPLTSLKTVEDKISEWLKASVSSNDGAFMTAEVLNNALTYRLMGKYLVDNNFIKWSFDGKDIAEFQLTASLPLDEMMGNIIVTASENGDTALKAIELKEVLTKDMSVQDIISDYENNLTHLKRFQGNPRVIPHADLKEYMVITVPAGINPTKARLDLLEPNDVMDVVSAMMAREARVKNALIVPFSIFGKTAQKMLNKNIPEFVKTVVVDIKKESAAEFKRLQSGPAFVQDTNLFWQDLAGGKFNNATDATLQGTNDDFGLGGFE